MPQSEFQGTHMHEKKHLHKKYLTRRTKQTSLDKEEATVKGDNVIIINSAIISVELHISS